MPRWPHSSGRRCWTISLDPFAKMQVTSRLDGGVDPGAKSRLRRRIRHLPWSATPGWASPVSPPPQFSCSPTLLFELELFSTMNPYLAPRLGIDSRAADNRGVCPKVDFEDARPPRRNPADSTSHRCLVRRLPSILLLLTRSIVSAPTPEQSAPGSSISDDGFSRAL